MFKLHPICHLIHMHAETHTHTHTDEWPWLFFSIVLSSVEQRQKALQSCEEKYLKFKENFTCKHLQTFSLCLVLSSSLYHSSSPSLRMLYGGCFLSLTLGYTMNMWCDPLLIPVGKLSLISALPPPHGGQGSEVGISYTVGTTWIQIQHLTWRHFCWIVSLWLWVFKN